MTVIFGAALLGCLALAFVTAVASIGHGWAFLFALAACGCCLGGAKFLFLRGERWVHRFVIYTGYGATFAVMGAASLRGYGVFALTGVWVLGSAGIFATKSLTVRWAVKHIPGYRA